VLRHRNLLAATESVTAAWRWTAGDRLVHCLPVFHAHGLAVGVYGTLLAGASAVLLPGFDPEAVVTVAEDHATTLFFGVPTMYHRLLASGEMGRLRGQRLCVSGSAPLSAELHAAVTAVSGIVVLERFGMTETLMNVSNPYEGERRAGTVGFPLPGVEVRLARTGDVGEESDGYLLIRGRTKEMIISGGFNVYPGEVEDVLAAHPAVAEVAVTGTASAEWGEVVTAWIVPDGPPPTVAELARFTQATLAAYKRPRLVHVVDELPRNALGKVVRSRLGT